MKPLIAALLILCQSLNAAYAQSNIAFSGIHYAVPRNTLHPGEWAKHLRQTYDCTKPCAIEFDDRLSAIHLRYKWMQLNTRENTYDFSDLGAVMDSIEAAGKKVTLVVMAGKYTPSWVFNKGAVRLGLAVKAHSSTDFSQKYIPAPWDPVYLNAYDKMLTALSAYLHQKPRRYQTLVLIKNGGVTVHSAEIRLMPPKAFFKKADIVKANKKVKMSSQLCREWAKIGYREYRVLDAMQKINASISRAFPDKALGLAFVTGSNRFPTISDETGECIKKMRNQTLSKIIKNMVINYRSRAVLNGTTLNRSGGDPDILDWVRNNGGNIGYQLNRQKVGCHQGAANSCNKDSFIKAVQRGIDDGAVFIEVHDGNIHRYKGILPKMNAILSR